MYCLVILLTFIPITICSVTVPQIALPPPAYVQKCCERNELIVEPQHKCRYANETDESPWVPVFRDELGRRTVKVSDVKFVIGVPGCGTRQEWHIYNTSLERMLLLEDGTLRHYILNDVKHDDDEEDDLSNVLYFHSYKTGSYCMEKKIDPNRKSSVIFAIVCTPKVSSGWKDTDTILRKILDPTFHIIGIICYTSVAMIHFVLPQLRDLVGNIITTMSVCLIVAQSADLVRIFTEFKIHSPLSFLIADIIMFISLLGAFFWLSSLGFYIWKTFRSRNVFLRITDGRKYCYYSIFVWSCTLGMSILAVFSHFTLETPDNSKPDFSRTQGTAIGWLGIAVFFSPIAFTIFANIYFYIATLQKLNRMSTYGRIHHKLKFCFETFLKLFVVMGIGWIFLLVSWLPYDGMYYSYIVINALEAPLILYISVLSQRRVRFLLRKACCYEKCICACFRPDQANDGPEWGEEMMAMNR